MNQTDLMKETLRQVSLIVDRFSNVPDEGLEEYTTRFIFVIDSVLEILQDGKQNLMRILEEKRSKLS